MITIGDYVAQIALDRGLVRRDQLGPTAGGDSAEISRTVAKLIAQGALDVVALGRVVAEESGMPFVQLGERRIAREVLAALPRDFVIRHQVCPVELLGETLVVALADPIALEVIDSLEHVAGRPVRAAIASEPDLRQAIRRHYEDGPEALAELIRGFELAENSPAVSTSVASEVGASDAPIIRLVQSIISEAVRRRASDIHLEPLERRFRVRYRIDGALVEADSPPKRLQLAVISRVKIMANISIAEKRVPQDGRIQVVLEGKSFDLRVSSLPTAHGESIVMRILDQDGVRLGLPELGFLPDDERAFSQLIASPDGIVLVTGPTGSGKTTTLYASLHALNKSERKIITVEDPVEYQLAGINQVPVRAEIGMTFAAALRAMLRQAPNIVMVGEIRDAETADIAINASLTGHLVFSTLHTNDAPSAVTRLIDIGAKPFLVAASLRATMAQRLVRRVCEACARDDAPSTSELAALGATPAQVAAGRFRRGAGCPECDGTGYRGRVGIFEIFLISDEIRALIYENASAARLRACARRAGMRTLREDGVRKVLAGLTTIEEVVAVTVGDFD